MAKRTMINFLHLIIDTFIFNLQFFAICIQSIFKVFTRTERDVSNDIVLITGSGSGLGREMAFEYAKLGAKIVCWDMNEANNQETVNCIKAKGQIAFGFTVDITNREKVLETSNRVLKEIGAVTILIQNAGIIVTKETLEHSENEIRKLYDVNVLAHYWLFQSFLPTMIEKERGHIVGICSMGGLLSLRNIVPYCSSKFAVRGLMEGLSNEVFMMTKGKIKFTTIYPFYINTGLFNEKLFKVRYNFITPFLNVVDTAKIIVSAQRKEISELSIPWRFFYVDKFFRLFPRKIYFLFNRYLGTVLE